MCGVVGILRQGHGPPPTPAELRPMIAAVRHRGPEAAGLYLDDLIGLGHARLSIVDVTGGLQPLTNEDASLWLICNGEVFNHVELRADLERRGHRFRTGSDCETILHLYEERGLACVHALNGQFAFALWDSGRRRLVLARDRLGVRPLFYTQAAGRLLFGSEIKALLTHAAVPREVDPVALGQVFTTWSPVPPRTMFAHVSSLRPGHMLVADEPGTRVHEYWRLAFPEQHATAPLAADQAAERLRELLLDATRLRLRADVPVGAYLSGGLDSSVVTALAQRYTARRLQTFAVAFTDPEFDERPYQERVAGLLGTEHHTITCGPEDVGQVFPEVIWHTETPLLRTAPAPLYLLARLVRQRGLKVVLTGEGADEFMVGYDIFKETRVRAFWAREPASRLRPRLLGRLYGHIPELARPSQAYLEAFFGRGLGDANGRSFSHAIRWANTGRLHRYFSADVRAAIAIAGTADLDQLQSAQEARWEPVSRAQHNEATTFLDPYLLSSQSDRVAMAHAVEGRFPFLDHRLVEFCNTLRPGMKMVGLGEKALLRRAVRELLPADVAARPKQPFRAPIQAVFAGPNPPAYVRDVLASERIRADGAFRPDAVAWLLERARAPAHLSETEGMALVGLVSFGLFKRAFWDDFAARCGSDRDDVVTVADKRTQQRQPAAAVTM